MKFFLALNESNLFSDYADVLDWIVCDEKFDDNLWDNKNKVQAFTKAIKKIDRLQKDRIIYAAKKDISFPSKGDYKKHSCPMICMSNGSSFARDFIRHIRNGIAHGNTQIFFYKDEWIVELLDYSKEGKKDEDQTAYFLIPLSYLLTIHSIYHQKEMSWKKKAKKRHSV